MANFLLLNGPNLNLLGTREPEVYGETTLEEVVEKLSNISRKSGHELISKQSNAEHELVDQIHRAKDEDVKCIIFNPLPRNMEKKETFQPYEMNEDDN